MGWLRRPIGSLGAYAGGRDNNFNLIRFLAATAVLLSHSFALAVGRSSAEPLRALLGTTLGQIAVDVFFLTSGFLVTASLIARADVRAFVMARVLRIYPGLIVAVLLTTAIVGWHFTTLTPREFFGSPDTWRYVLKNATMVTREMHTLPGAFEHTPWRHLVNASLWTLPYELTMYLVLALLWVALSVIGATRQLRQIIVGIAVLAGIALLATQELFESNALRLSAMFFVGSAFYTLRNVIPMRTAFFLALLGAVVASGLTGPLFKPVYFVSLPYLVFFVAYVPDGIIRRFNGFGDCSYGLYIYAWPVQQCTASLLPGIEPPAMFAVSFAATLALASASWRLVEKPALSLKQRDVRTTDSGLNAAKLSKGSNVR